MDNNAIPSTLVKLWNLADGDPTNPESNWNATFLPIGLILLTPPENYGYWCTPTNSLTFAGTGGDGVHYGLLAENGQFTDSSPVVMTVPMCNTPNMVLGANLLEFLALGCRFGYFSLEQLIYEPEETLQELEQFTVDEEMGADECALLRLLTEEFQLSPWPNPRQRLAELQAMFLSSLQLPHSSKLIRK